MNQAKSSNILPTNPLKLWIQEYRKCGNLNFKVMDRRVKNEQNRCPNDSKTLGIPYAGLNSTHNTTFRSSFCIYVTQNGKRTHQ